MERRVKERLIGAAVLMAAAVILIPEMLSGPEAPQLPPDKSAAAPAALKTYTIDLSQASSNESPHNVPIEERAPPPESTLPVPDEPAPHEESAVAGEAKPEHAQPAQRDAQHAIPSPAERADQRAPSQRVVEAPTRAPPGVNVNGKPTATPLASVSSAPITRGWAVQIGSFSRQDTAERLASELRAGGHQAFVMPVKSQSSTLYRVRVGPVQDRASAESALNALKGRAPKAAVVTHP